MANANWTSKPVRHAILMNPARARVPGIRLRCHAAMVYRDLRQIRRLQGEGLRFDAFEWENKFQVTEAGEYPVDLGFIVELERPQDRSEGYEMRFGPLFRRNSRDSSSTLTSWSSATSRQLASLTQSSATSGRPSIAGSRAWSTACRDSERSRNGTVGGLLTRKPTDSAPPYSASLRWVTGRLSATTLHGSSAFPREPLGIFSGSRSSTSFERLSKRSIQIKRKPI